MAYQRNRQILRGSRADSSVPLMRHDPSDLGSLIQIRIIPKERTLCDDCNDDGDDVESINLVAVMMVKALLLVGTMM